MRVRFTTPSGAARLTTRRVVPSRDESGRLVLKFSTVERAATIPVRPDSPAPGSSAFDGADPLNTLWVVIL